MQRRVNSSAGAPWALHRARRDLAEETDRVRALLMLGCLLAVVGAMNLVFAYPSGEARRRRQWSSEILRDLERTGGPAAVAMGARLAFIHSLTARHPWVYFVASPIALVSGIVLIACSG